MNILDCTIRDGGYYTNWDFDRKLVLDYCKLVKSLPIDIIHAKSTLTHAEKNKLSTYKPYYIYNQNEDGNWEKSKLVTKKHLIDNIPNVLNMK